MKKRTKLSRPIGFTATPLALLGHELVDDLILYMYKIEKNAIVLENNELNFIKVEHVNDDKKEDKGTSNTER